VISLRRSGADTALPSGATLLRFNDLHAWPGTGSDRLASAAGMRSNQRCYDKGERIYARNEPAHHVYVVIQGAVRASRCLSDGRRHLSAFHLPGEIFGLGTGPIRSLETEAVVKSTMLAVRLEDLEREASIDPGLAWRLCRIAADDLRNAHDHLLVLGRMSAFERVAAFLLEMDRRLFADGIMNLPMSGEDIADYLGLNNATVSRCLTRLQALRIIDLTNRRTVTFLDRAGLREIDAC
jgi:CRP-like cAMP-binding protein